MKLIKLPTLYIFKRNYLKFVTQKIDLIVLSKTLLFISLLSAFSSLFSQKPISTIDTNFIYDLPFTYGKKTMVMQGYNGTYSHKGNYALDFRMRKGSQVFAAREGTVHKTVEEFQKGGPKKKYLSKGNHIIIKHNDGTYAAYWHLAYQGALVQAKDTVQKGQLIGLSGNTGYSSWPHLHFDVYYFSNGRQITIPTKFSTTKGIKQLKVFRKYRKPLPNLENNNPIQLPKNIDKIEYHFQDASVSPEYHRSYTWIVNPNSVQYILDSYGTILKDTTIAISALKWEQCKTAFLNCEIRNKKTVKSNLGCTGGTGVTIHTWLNGKENFSGSKYNCGGKTEGNLAGDTDKFLLYIQMGIDPAIFENN